MAYNDPMGEWIRPKHPDIFEREPPLFPRRRLHRVKSCPDTPTAVALAECDLVNREGYFLWDDLFKVMSEKVGIAIPATKAIGYAVEETLEHLSTIKLQPPPSGYRFRSTGDIARVANGEQVLTEKELARLDSIRSRGRSRQTESTDKEQESRVVKENFHKVGIRITVSDAAGEDLKR